MCLFKITHYVDSGLNFVFNLTHQDASRSTKAGCPRSSRRRRTNSRMRWRD
nr:MAG TPA: hypothetical protein [Caudoviricetes sp.]